MRFFFFKKYVKLLTPTKIKIANHLWWKNSRLSNCKVLPTQSFNKLNFISNIEFKKADSKDILEHNYLYKFQIVTTIFLLYSHPSEIRGLCLIKWHSEMLQSFAIFLEYDNPGSFFVFSFHANVNGYIDNRHLFRGNIK